MLCTKKRLLSNYRRDPRPQSRPLVMSGERVAGRRRYFQLLVFVTVLACVTVTLVLRPIILSPGIPAMRQDWQWPITHGGVAAMFGNLSSPVIPAEWDAVAWLPRVNVIQPVFLLVNTFVSSVITLKIFLFTTLLMAALGAYSLARALGGVVLLSCAAMLFYVASPFVINELVAGHLWILFAYACTPFLVEALIRKRYWPAVFLWTATTSIDIHFLGFDILIAVALAVAGVVPFREQRGFVLGLIAFIPAVVGAACASHSVAFEGQHTIPFYEIVNSTSVTDAVRGLGYMAGYDRIYTQPLSWLLLIPFIVALWLVARRKWLALILMLTGSVIAAGVNGPLSLLEEWAFNHIVAASVFRELYDAIAIFNLGAVVALGSAAVPSAMKWILSVAVLVSLLPGIDAGYKAMLPSIVTQPGELRLVQTFERSSGSSQMLALPAQIPISMRTFAGGLDPLGNMLSAHGLIGSEHVLPGPARAGIGGGTKMAGWFALLHTSAILNRPGWRSLARFRLEPGFGEPSQPPRPPLPGSWVLTALHAQPRLTVQPADLCVAGSYRLVARLATYSDDDPACLEPRLRRPVPFYPYPSRGWVNYDSLWFLAPGASSALPEALYTTKKGISYPRPKGCQIGRSYTYDGFKLENRRWIRFTRIMVGCHAPSAAHPTVLSGAHFTNTKIERLSARGNVAVIVSLPWLELAHVSMHGSAMVSLIAQYSSFWGAETEGRIHAGEHHLLEGFFNGWNIRGDGRGVLLLIYWPAIPIVLSELAVAIALILCFIRVLIKWGR